MPPRHLFLCLPIDVYHHMPAFSLRPGSHRKFPERGQQHREWLPPDDNQPQWRPKRKESRSRKTLGLRATSRIILDHDVPCAQETCLKDCSWGSIGWCSGGSIDYVTPEGVFFQMDLTWRLFPGSQPKARAQDGVPSARSWTQVRDQKKK